MCTIETARSLVYAYMRAGRTEPQALRAVQVHHPTAYQALLLEQRAALAERRVARYTLTDAERRAFDAPPPRKRVDAAARKRPAVVAVRAGSGKPAARPVERSAATAKPVAAKTAAPKPATRPAERVCAKQPVAIAPPASRYSAIKTLDVPGCGNLAAMLLSALRGLRVE